MQTGQRRFSIMGSSNYGDIIAASVAAAGRRHVRQRIREHVRFERRVGCVGCEL
jgi:hypothetical protein